MARDRSRAAYRAATLQRRRTYCYSDPIGVLGVGWEELKRPTKPYCRPPLRPLFPSVQLWDAGRTRPDAHA